MPLDQHRKPTCEHNRANGRLPCQTGVMGHADLRWRQRLQSLQSALGQLWIEMLEQRNLMAHTYDVHRAQQALAMIRDRFAPALLAQAADLEQRP